VKNETVFVFSDIESRNILICRSWSHTQLDRSKGW